MDWLKMLFSINVCQLSRNAAILSLLLPRLAHLGYCTLTNTLSVYILCKVSGVCYGHQMTCLDAMHHYVKWLVWVALRFTSTCAHIIISEVELENLADIKYIHKLLLTFLSPPFFPLYLNSHSL